MAGSRTKIGKTDENTRIILSHPTPPAPGLPSQAPRPTPATPSQTAPSGSGRPTIAQVERAMDYPIYGALGGALVGVACAAALGAPADPRIPPAGPAVFLGLAGSSLGLLAGVLAGSAVLASETRRGNQT